ncbi:MAG: hypothetical protein ACFCU1_06035 [Sumerlaeia bacterium]
MSEKNLTNLSYEDSKYLSITVIAKRAKDIAKAYNQPSTSEVYFDPLEAAIDDYNKGKMTVFRRNEFSGELEKF